MIRKQVKFEVDIRVHTRLRDEAARRRLTITDLILAHLRPFLEQLPPAQCETQTATCQDE